MYVGLVERRYMSMNSGSGSGSAAGWSGSGGGTGLSAALLRWMNRVSKKLLGVTIVCGAPSLRRLERVESISIRTNQPSYVKDRVVFTFIYTYRFIASLGVQAHVGMRPHAIPITVTAPSTQVVLGVTPIQGALSRPDDTGPARHLTCHAVQNMV
jgi:hypothetical protein